MKCFYHEEKDAVGQCQLCGKGLCKNCLIEHNGICDDCYFANKADSIDNEHNDMYAALTEYKSTIIKSLIWGGILGVIFALLMLDAGALMAIFALFTPTGYMALSRVFGKDPHALRNNTLALLGTGSKNDMVSSFAWGFLLAKLFMFFVKIAIAAVIGIPCTAYLVYKLVDTNKQLTALENDYNAVVEDYKEELKNKKN